MKKNLSMLILATVIVLMTATFGFAEYAAAGPDNFPYFELGCLVIGGLMIFSLKKRYPKMYLSEAIGSFACYTAMVALFTAPVIDAIRGFLG